MLLSFVMDNLHLRQRISERTGLTDDQEISAYIHFCHHADLRDGVIMYGDVKHEFYKEFMDAQDSDVQRREKKFWEKVSNHRLGLTEEELRKVESPFSLKAGELYEHYLEIFIRKRLIQAPRHVGQCTTAKYPVLSAYNYFNDPDIYIIESKEGSESRTLRVI